MFNLIDRGIDLDLDIDKLFLDGLNESRAIASLALSSLRRQPEVICRSRTKLVALLGANKSPQLALGYAMCFSMLEQTPEEIAEVTPMLRRWADHKTVGSGITDVIVRVWGLS
jgi:hypothetical protein